MFEFRLKFQEFSSLTTLSNIWDTV